MKNINATQRGMALIAVLWLVAAMGLIITGIVQSVRGEIKIAGSQRQALVAGALADAAILLALQNLQAQKKEQSNTLQTIPVKFDGLNIAVSTQPLNGLIDINTAPISLLADMYQYAGGLSAQAAQTMAQATIETREFKSMKGVPQRFDAIEDLLRVQTMTYDLYAKIIGLVTADVKEGSGRVNAMVAPAGVIVVLARGDVARSAVLMAQRNADPKGMEMSFLLPAHIDTASSNTLGLQVAIPMTGGEIYNKSWLVYWGADPHSGLPWRVLDKKYYTSLVANGTRQFTAPSMMNSKVNK